MKGQALLMMRLALSLVLATSISTAATTVEGAASEPTIADVAALERVVRLPPAAEPIDAYARYYSLVAEDGRAMLIGTYLLNAPDPPGRYIRSVPVLVLDGGCSVVNVRFDLAKRRVVGAFCNGVA
ncbi:hypothetical protein [Phenylobacterium sp.]|uniref:hypothetical protein n=1 Tax=Phenylobacterium sp. TaxID=1871053 RepID=UPI004035714A